MNEFKNCIDLAPLNDETIAERKYSLSDLWMAKDENNEVYGPYPTDELREYSQKYKYLFDNVMVYNLETENWYKFFEVKHFQRRKPQLVSAQNLINDNNFFVLQNGQKRGPFTLSKMHDLLATGHITPNTQISLDLGESWIKLYEHHAFDRRNKKKTGDLPFIPNKDILFQQVKNVEARVDESDPLLDLIYIKTLSAKSSPEDKTMTQITGQSGIMTKTQIISNATKQLDEDKTIAGEKIKVGVKQQELQGNSKFAVMLASFVLLAGLGFGANYFWSHNKKTIGKEAKTSSKSIDNTDRSVSKKTSKAIKRKPASTQTKLRKKPRRIQPKRYIPKPRRVEPARAEKRIEVYNEPEDLIDPRDPDIQEEFTRALAGDRDGEEDYPEDNDPRYDDQDQDSYNEGSPDNYGENYPEANDRADDGYFDEPSPQDNDDYGYDAEYNE